MRQALYRMKEEWQQERTKELEISSSIAISPERKKRRKGGSKEGREQIAFLAFDSKDDDDEDRFR